MKLSQHDTYSDTKEALIALTKTCFKTGDVKIKEFRDDLEQYLQETEYQGNRVSFEELEALEPLEGIEGIEENEINEHEE